MRKIPKKYKKKYIIIVFIVWPIYCFMFFLVDYLYFKLGFDNSYDYKSMITLSIYLAISWLYVALSTHDALVTIGDDGDLSDLLFLSLTYMPRFLRYKKDKNKSAGDDS